ncbi:Hypothetical protein CAP_8923 [Chondromyces apiculatus DSM 436]|uniref:Uncharacterized protein n=1 Tax=Chondromyces apiculatus DSM 436 TaxID=1192034 RepID=A0A017SX50_9BACT|nr:Hypothetical protein CAP_8923 [Chondromyces apiculatus DSM 436]
MLIKSYSPSNEGTNSGPGKEIDPGYYHVKQDGKLVARVFVDDLAIDEYWELFNEPSAKYKYPSSVDDNRHSRDISLNFIYQGPGTLAAFKADVRENSELIHMQRVDDSEEAR